MGRSGAIWLWRSSEPAYRAAAPGYPQIRPAAPPRPARAPARPARLRATSPSSGARRRCVLRSAQAPRSLLGSSLRCLLQAAGRRGKGTRGLCAPRRRAYRRPHGRRVARWPGEGAARCWRCAARWRPVRGCWAPRPGGPEGPRRARGGAGGLRRTASPSSTTATPSCARRWCPCGCSAPRSAGSTRWGAASRAASCWCSSCPTAPASTSRVRAPRWVGWRWGRRERGTRGGRWDVEGGMAMGIAVT